MAVMVGYSGKNFNDNNSGKFVLPLMESSFNLSFSNCLAIHAHSTTLFSNYCVD